MSTEWFCKLNDRVVGPVTLQQIKAMADRGTLLPADLIRRGETGTWLAAGKVRGLFASKEAPAAAQPSPAGDAEVAKSRKAPRLPQAESIPVGTPLTQDDTLPPDMETILPVDSLPTKPAKPTKGPTTAAPSPEATVRIASRKPSSKSTPPARQDDIFEELLATQTDVLHRGKRSGGRRSDPAEAVSDLHEARRRKKKQIKLLLPLAVLLGVLGVSAGVYYFGFRTDPAKLAQVEAEKARVAQETQKKAAAAQLKDDTEDDDVRRQAVAKSSSGAIAAASGSASTAASGSAAVAAAPADLPPATAADATTAKGGAGDHAWVDASKASAELKEQKLTVKVVSARFGLPPKMQFPTPRGGNNRAPLTITVVLENNDLHRKTEYQAWSGGGATLRGDFGLKHEQILVRSSVGRKRVVNAGDPQTDFVVFEHPTEIAERYQLELPAAAVGGQGVVRFEIPRTMITGSLDPALEGVKGAQTTAKLFGPKGEGESAPMPAAPASPTAAAEPPKPMEDPDAIPPLEIGGEKVKQTKTRGGLK